MSSEVRTAAIAGWQRGKVRTSEVVESEPGSKRQKSEWTCSLSATECTPVAPQRWGSPRPGDGCTSWVHSWSSSHSGSKSWPWSNGDRGGIITHSVLHPQQHPTTDTWAASAMRGLGAGTLGLLRMADSFPTRVGGHSGLAAVA